MATVGEPSHEVGSWGERIRSTVANWWRGLACSDPSDLPPRANGQRSIWSWVAFGVLLIAVRAPQLVIAPRLWAEEGALYLSYALRHSFWQALASSHLGYFSLVPSLASALAARVPLELSPTVTMTVALVVQLLPVLVIGRLGASWFPWWSRAMCVVAVCLSPLVGEGWLNSINSQFYVALATALILIFPTPSSRGSRITLAAVLALSGLSSPQVCLLLPGFALRAVLSRRTAHLGQMLVVLATTLVQLAAFLGHDGLRDRGAGASLLSVGGAALTKTVLWPFIGLGPSIKVSKLLTVPSSPAQEWVLTACVWIVLGALIWWVAQALPTGWPRLAFALAYLCLTVSSGFLTLASGRDLVHPFDSHRYYLAPAALVAVALVARLRLAPQGARRLSMGLAAVALIVMVIQGSYQPRRWFWARGWPAWRVEVARWRQDRTYPIRLWPDGWYLRPPT